MPAWKRQSLASLLLLLVAFSYLLNLITVVSTRAEPDVCSPFVLVESVEESETEESGEFVLLARTESSGLAFEVTNAAHLTEECEFDKARHRKSHLGRGPPPLA